MPIIGSRSAISDPADRKENHHDRVGHWGGYRQYKPDEDRRNFCCYSRGRASSEFLDQRTLGVQLPQPLVRLFCDRRYQPIVRSLANDIPVIVMEEHVVVFAKQHAVFDVRESTITVPLVDVMRFTLGWWSCAVREQASAISHTQHQSLVRTE